MRERELTSIATESLRNTGVDEIVSVELATGESESDAQLELRTGEETHTFQIQVKRNVNVATVARIADQIRSTQKSNVLLITERVVPSVAVALRDRRISYLDAAGNCHISIPGFFLHVSGKTTKKQGSGAEPVKALKKSGLKVIFLMLLEPTMANETYRDLAMLSGASLGVVQYTMDDLVRLGMIERLGKSERRLRSVADLLERWTTAYAENLRPRQIIGRFRFADRRDASSAAKLTLDEPDERWGGEAAAAQATNYLKPGIWTLYSRQSRGDIQKRHRLLPDPEGIIEVVQPFWPRVLETRLPHSFAQGCVPLALTYADLIASGDPRNAETAEIIRTILVEEADNG